MTAPVDTVESMARELQPYVRPWDAAYWLRAWIEPAIGGPGDIMVNIPSDRALNPRGDIPEAVKARVRVWIDRERAARGLEPAR